MPRDRKTRSEEVESPHKKPLRREVGKAMKTTGVEMGASNPLAGNRVALLPGDVTTVVYRKEAERATEGGIQPM